MPYQGGRGGQAAQPNFPASAPDHLLINKQNTPSSTKFGFWRNRTFEDGVHRVHLCRHRLHTSLSGLGYCGSRQVAPQPALTPWRCSTPRGTSGTCTPCTTCCGSGMRRCCSPRSALASAQRPGYRLASWRTVSSVLRLSILFALLTPLPWHISK